MKKQRRKKEGKKNQYSLLANKKDARKKKGIRKQKEGKMNGIRMGGRME